MAYTYTEARNLIAFSIGFWSDYAPRPRETADYLEPVDVILKNLGKSAEHRFPLAAMICAWDAATACSIDDCREIAGRILDKIGV